MTKIDLVKVTFMANFIDFTQFFGFFPHASKNYREERKTNPQSVPHLHAVVELLTETF